MKRSDRVAGTKLPIKVSRAAHVTMMTLLITLIIIRDTKMTGGIS